MRAPALTAAVLTTWVGMLLATTAPVALAGGDPCTNPSDDMILSCLKPGKTRGIRPGGVPAAAADPAPYVPAARPAPAPVREAVVRPQPVVARQAAPVVQTAPAVPVAQPAAAGGIVLTLEFPAGSAEPSADTKARLEGLGRKLATPEAADLRLRIEGHTDTTGGREMNKALSQRRADAIVAYLNTKFGLPAGKLEAVGVGEDELLVPTGANVSEPRNRVVRIVPLSS